MTKSCLAQVSQMLCQLTYGGQLEYSGTNDCFLWGERDKQQERQIPGGRGANDKKDKFWGGEGMTKHLTDVLCSKPTDLDLFFFSAFWL